MGTPVSMVEGGGGDTAAQGCTEPMMHCPRGSDFFEPWFLYFQTGINNLYVCMPNILRTGQGAHVSMLGVGRTEGCSPRAAPCHPSACAGAYQAPPGPSLGPFAPAPPLSLPSSKLPSSCHPCPMSISVSALGRISHPFYNEHELLP